MPVDAGIVESKVRTRTTQVEEERGEFITGKEKRRTYRVTTPRVLIPDALLHRLVPGREQAGVAELPVFGCATWTSAHSDKYIFLRGQG
jgi:hypothetical protein